MSVNLLDESAAQADGPLLFTPEQAGAALGISVDTVKRWTKQGHLESVRLPGGHLRIVAADVRRLARGEAAAATDGCR